MKRIIATVAFLGLSGVAMAASYGPQGCGLGSTIFTDNSSLVDQVLGATTNSTSGNQTFGMTSGTSNCELDGKGKGSAQAVFIEANKVALANDIAKGHGETLASLTKLYGCSDVAAVGSALQKNYEAIFTKNKSAESIDAAITGILSDNQACI